jgi:Tol biopolymer transport system component
MEAPSVPNPATDLASGRRRARAAVLLLATLASSLALVPSRPAGASTPQSVSALVSAAAGPTAGNGAATSLDLASDGRFVAFASTSTNLVAGTTTAVQRIYLRDLWTNDLTLVSRTSAGDPNQEHALLGSISPDGEWIVFSTKQALVPTDVNGFVDVYLWRRSTKAIELVSLTNDEQLGNADSGFNLGDARADVSDDGRYVFFTSAATNLGTDTDSNGKVDIFRRDRAGAGGGTTIRASLDAAVQFNGDSFHLDASATGRYLVWATLATNVTGTDSNGTSDIVLRDFNSISLQKVSLGLDADANGGSLYPKVSDDGDLIAFESSASDLSPADTNAKSDVFTRRRSTSTTTRMSVGVGFVQLPAGGTRPDLTPDGTRVSFLTAGSAVATDDNGRTDLYVSEASVNQLVSFRGDGTQLQQNIVFGSISDDDAGWISTDASVPADTNNQSDAYVRTSPFLSTFTSFDVFVALHLSRFTGSPTTMDALVQNRAPLLAGQSPYTWMLSLADAPTFADKRAPVVRLYWAYFKRRPDLGGLNFWINRYRNGWRLVDISQEFAKSSEFKTKYGNTTPEQFVTLVYQNVLEREPEAGGLSFWANRIRNGTPRGQVMTNFSESSEGRRVIGPRSDVILLGIGMYGKIPSQALFDAIVAERKAGEVREIAVIYLLGAPEYIATLP